LDAEFQPTPEIQPAVNDARASSGVVDGEA
jgi:hypothetical protein